LKTGLKIFENNFKKLGTHTYTYLQHIFNECITNALLLFWGMGGHGHVIFAFIFSIKLARAVPFKLKQHTVMGIAKKFYRVQTWLWSLYQ
jgi:hypothetical protein